MVGHRLGGAEPQELTQGQAVGAAPFEPTLAVDPLEVADQVQAEIAARRQRRMPPLAGIVRRALRLGKAVEPGREQHGLQTILKDVPRRAGQFRPADHQLRLSFTLPPQRHARSSRRHGRNESAQPDFVNALLEFSFDLSPTPGARLVECGALK